MVYRKRRNGRRRNGYRRAHRYMNTAAKALSIARSVKAIVNSEKKTFDTNLTGFISQTGSIDCLTSIRQGDDYNMREGRSILLKSLQIVGNYQVNPDSEARPVAILRFILVRDNGYTGVTPTLSQILDSELDVQSLRNPEPANMKRFTTIWDKQYKLTRNAYAYQRINLFKKMHQHVKFDGTGQDDVNTGSLYLVRLSTELSGVDSAPIENLNIRVRYYDN